MKRTTLFTLSIFLITGIGFAQNIKTLDKSKMPQPPGEMMIKLDKQYSKEDLEKLTTKELKELTKELEESKQQKKAKTPMTKYPQFAGTIAEEYIRAELVKNPNWEIKGISYNGVKKKFVIMPSEGGYEKDTFPYTLTTTSGKKVITCEYDFQNHEMSAAVSLWVSDVMKAKYPEFIGTAAEGYIKTELKKNIDWQIKDISFKGAKKELAVMPSEGSGYGNIVYHPYTLITTSGEKIIVCGDKNNSDKMQIAIKTWENK